MLTIKSKIVSTCIIVLVFSIFINACASPTPMIVEVTREIPQTIMVTQIVTQMVTPEPSVTPSPTSTSALVSVVVPTITSLPTQSIDFGDAMALKKSGYYVYYPVEGCGPSIVKRGFRVYVSYDGGKNAIRSNTDIASAGNIIGYALPGEYMKVIGGPACVWGWLLWLVQMEGYDLEGWTPESDGKSFWLVPDTSNYGE